MPIIYHKTEGQSQARLREKSKRGNASTDDNSWSHHKRDCKGESVFGNAKRWVDMIICEA